MKRFTDLTEPEVLALAISNEEEDARIYRSFAAKLRTSFPASAAVFDEMADEEQRHRHQLLEMYEAKFGKELPYITRQDVRGEPWIVASDPLSGRFHRFNVQAWRLVAGCDGRLRGAVDRLDAKHVLCQRQRQTRRRVTLDAPQDHVAHRVIARDHVRAIISLMNRIASGEAV